MLRSKAFRCRADKPPQMPYGSLWSSAYCKHGRFTGQTAQIAFAAGADWFSPGGGKNSGMFSGRQAPCTCQLGRS